MRASFTIMRRELAAYFSTPLAFVFMVAFLAAVSAATFYFGDFMERRQANLSPFFGFHPWLFLVLIPAVGMRLWAEERGQGTIELLMTLPVTPWQVVIGKFLAAWTFIAISLALTFPIWITVNYLGDPDNGVIFASYVASLLMAGAMLAATACVSALTNRQVIAFVFGVAINFLLMVSGLSLILNAFSGWAPPYLVDLIASFSFLTHFDTISRGVLDLGALIFFGALILLFLFVNRQLVDTRKTFATPASILAIVLFFGVNLIAGLVLNNARYDLTEGRIYTVSDSTRAVLDGVTEPVTLRLYLSTALVEEASAIRPFSERVKELLHAYSQLSDGRVRVEIIDPQPFSAEEDKAIGYDLVGFNLSRAGERGYIGLVGTNAVDQIETIPALAPSREAYLEYDLTRMVRRLASPTEPKIGVIDGLGMFGSQALGRRPSALIERLGDDYELVQLRGTVTLIPDDIDVLLVVHPHDLNDSTLYAIDQYVIRGGPLLAFLDGLSEHSPPHPTNPAVPQFPDSNLDRLMAQWGVEMVAGYVVGDLSMAIEIRAQAGNQVIVADYPPWLIVDRDNLNPDDIVTAQLSLMRISSAGALQRIPGAATTFTELIRTTTDSMLYEQSAILRRANPTSLVDAFVSSGVVRVLAGRIIGVVDTAFPDGAPPVPPPAEGAEPPADPAALVVRSERPIAVIIVTDTDMLTDDLNIAQNGQATTQNTDFVINALDSLTGGVELIGLRGRGLSFRPFIRLDELERAAEERYRSTEQQLQAELDATEARLADLRSQATAPDGQIGALTRQQQDAITEINQRIIEVREELREVRGALRKEIDAVSNQLRLVNILAAPLAIILIGVLLTLWRRARLSRYLRGRQTAH